MGASRYDDSAIVAAITKAGRECGLMESEIQEAIERLRAEGRAMQ